jgi:hypothetical protein
MNKYKIVKEIHMYHNNELKFRIYEKCAIGWNKLNKEYATYELAELAILDQFIDKLNNTLSGIVEVDNNVYTFYPYSLSI